MKTKTTQREYALNATLSGDSEYSITREESIVQNHDGSRSYLINGQNVLTIRFIQHEDVWTKSYYIGNLKISNNCYRYLEIPTEISRDISTEFRVSCNMTDISGKLLPNKSLDILYDQEGHLSEIRHDGVQIIAANPPEDGAPMCVVHQFGDISVMPISVKTYKILYRELEFKKGIHPKSLKELNALFFHNDDHGVMHFEHLVAMGDKSGLTNYDSIFRSERGKTVDNLQGLTKPPHETPLAGQDHHDNHCCEIF
jgi:hypothetical protein